MTKFNANQSLGEIVAIMPKASEVFKAYNIDFCCGGHRPLAEAIKEGKLNEEELLQKLDKTYEETKKISRQVDFRKMSNSDLIDHVVNTHHVYLRKTLPHLGELISTILRVHGPNHEELFKVHKLFNNLKTELEQHLIKEEEILFPMIKEYEKTPSEELLKKIAKVVKETEDEHDAAGDILKELRKITGEYCIPDDGCTTYGLSYDTLKELESDLFEHIHLENNILFKRLGINV